VWDTLRSDEAKRFFSRDQQDKLVAGVEVEKHDALVQMFASVNPDVVVNCIGLIEHHKEAEDPQMAFRSARCCTIAW
jgi:dTDP-4-dehydrorhamnose reductase